MFCGLKYCNLCHYPGGYDLLEEMGVKSYRTNKIRVSTHFRPVIYKCPTQTMLQAVHRESNSSFNWVTAVFGDDEKYCKAPFNCKTGSAYGLGNCPGPSHVFMPTASLHNPAKCYLQKIKNVQGICLDAKSASYNGDKPHMWPCSLSDQVVIGNQNWAYDKATGRITNVGTGMCLDANSDPNESQEVHMWNCIPEGDSNGNQKWTFDKYGLLRSAQGLCLSAVAPDTYPKGIKPGAFTTGAKLQMATCDEHDANMQWIWSYGNTKYGGPTVS